MTHHSPNQHFLSTQYPVLKRHYLLLPQSECLRLSFPLTFRQAANLIGNMEGWPQFPYPPMIVPVWAVNSCCMSCGHPQVGWESQNVAGIWLRPAQDRWTRPWQTIQQGFGLGNVMKEVNSSFTRWSYPKQRQYFSLANSFLSGANIWYNVWARVPLGVSCHLPPPAMPAPP